MMRSLSSHPRLRRPRPWNLPDLLAGESGEDDRDEGTENLSTAEVQAEIEAAVHIARQQAREQAWAEARKEMQRRIAQAEERVRREMKSEVVRASETAAEAAKILQAVIHQWQEACSVWLDRLEDNVLALSIAVSRHVLQAELDLAPEKVRAIVQAALKKASVWDEPVRVRLHPDDLSALDAVQDDGFKALIASFKDVDWISDDSLQRGDCLVEGLSKLIDGRVDVALQSLYEQVSDNE